MNKETFDFIFIVLTYRNRKDLQDFIRCTQKKVTDTYKIIIVNSYYDEESYNEFLNIAMNNECDFINVENKGYGFGNNRGIEYAKEKYSFRYLIISNPDIEIINFSMKELAGFENHILAPTINTLTGKNQNPYYYSKIELIEWLKYYSCISGHKIFAYIGIILNKLYREIGLFLDRCLKVKKRKIYAAHGSFIIFSSSALDKLGTLYNEKMFLFSEENHLARLALENSVDTYMIPSIKVLHREDGSVGLENEKLNNIGEESFLIYYKHWIKKQ